MTIFTDPFQIKDISLQNIDRIQLASASAGRNAGRRFSITCDGKKNEVIYHHLFQQAKQLYKIANSIDELKTLKGYVSKLRTLESSAIEEYDQRDCLYQFCTWFHRLFGEAFFGSHMDRVDTLDLKITDKLQKAGFRIPHPILEEAGTLFTSVLRKKTLSVVLNGSTYIIWAEKENKKFFMNIQKQDDHQAGNKTGRLQLELFNGLVSSVVFEGANATTVPTGFDDIFKGAVKEALKAASSYKRSGNSLKISVIKENLSAEPEWHLNQLCKLLAKANQPDIFVDFIGNDLKSTGIVDGGGLRRDYIDDLVNALQQNPSLFIEVDGVKLPRILKHDMTPQKAIWECSDAERETYQNLGKLMALCYNSVEEKSFLSIGDDKGTLTTGCYFSDALFRAALCLSSNEIDTPFAMLGKETHIKIARALLQNWDLPDLADIDLVISLLNPVTLQKHLDTQDSKTLLKAAYLSSNPDAYLNNDLSSLNKQAIQDNPQQFIEELYQGIFSHCKLIDGLKTSLGSILSPIHSLAQGMQAIQTSDSATDVSVKVQGSLDRSSIINSLTYNDLLDPEKYTRPASTPNPVIKKLNLLKNWLKQDASDQEVKQFIKFVTGASSLPKNKLIQVTHDSQPGLLLPKAYTCAFLLLLPGADAPDKDFIQNLKDAIKVTDYQMG